MKKLIPPILLLFFLVFFSCESDGSFTDKSSFDSSEEGAFSDGDGTTDGDGQGSEDPDNSGIITAGEWNDLDNWSFWNSILNSETYDKMPAYWKFNTSNRLSFSVTDATGKPAVDISIILKESNTIIWEAKTDNKGKAELWALSQDVNKSANLTTYQVFVNDVPLNKMLKSFSEGINEVQLTTNFNAKTTMELAFIVDATGSMGDEMNFLKDDLKKVIQNVKNANGLLKISTGTVFYRDEGDDYVIKKSPFTQNLTTTLDFIEAQSANGGGDFPEAVHTALRTAVTDLQWSSTAQTRIAFLLLDAPPHYEAQIVDDLHLSIKKAAQKGIKVIPIVASGINKETEFLMRYFSISTNGTYVFITNDSGVGNEHLEPTVGEYDVEILKDLLVRLITKYSE